MVDIPMICLVCLLAICETGALSELFLEENVSSVANQ
jgi:hypothetical protein